MLGHEGAGIVREIGAGVISLVLGDHVIPLHTPQCRQCKNCLSGKTNQCTAIRATQGQSVIDPMITHILTLEEINKGSALSHAGEFIRSGVSY